MRLQTTADCPLPTAYFFFFPPFDVFFPPLRAPLAAFFAAVLLGFLPALEALRAATFWECR